MLEHENLLKMKNHFFTVESNEEEYLNVIMDFYPDNLYQVIKQKVLTPYLIKVFSYQILKGLDYLNTKAVAHRDIKPQNIIVNPYQKILKLIDWGLA